MHIGEMNSCTPCFRQSLAVALLVVACSIEGSRAAESLDGQFKIGKANSALVALVKAGWWPDKQPMVDFADMEQQFGSRGDRVRFGMNFGVWRRCAVAADLCLEEAPHAKGPPPSPNEAKLLLNARFVDVARADKLGKMERAVMNTD